MAKRMSVFETLNLIEFNGISQVNIQIISNETLIQIFGSWQFVIHANSINRAFKKFNEQSTLIQLSLMFNLQMTCSRQ